MSTTHANRRRSPWRYLGLLAVGLAGLGGDCSPDVVKDPTFRDWCGDNLCAWNLDAGRIARVATWDANDFGVSFLDSPTQISQATAENSATCLLFTSVANIDPAAQMSIGVDFNNDGSIDKTWPLGSAQWQRVQIEIAAPTRPTPGMTSSVQAAYSGIRFILRKDGTGTAVLAEMRIQATTDCSTANPSVTLKNLAIGEPCTSDAECASGVCPQDGFPVCSQCTLSGQESDPHPCPGGVACTERFYGIFSPTPLQCGPGQKLGKPGDPCVSNDDCKSDVCSGAVPVSPGGDAGPCDLEADAGADNCANYTVHGGTCN